MKLTKFSYWLLKNSLGRMDYKCNKNILTKNAFYKNQKGVNDKIFISEAH
jgi:hypothetical protein